MTRHKVFVSYHHANDEWYKRELAEFGEAAATFIDRSVGMGDIPDDLDDQAIRRRIRDEHLRDSTVTIVLIGTGTKRRKHVEWETTQACTTARSTRDRGSWQSISPP